MGTVNKKPTNEAILSEVTKKKDRKPKMRSK